MNIKKHEERLLSFGSGIFIAVFFTSLLMWILNNTFGNIYLFSGFIVYYLVDHLIFRKNDSKKLEVVINGLVFGLGVVLFFHISTVVGILMLIPAIVYGIFSYEKFSKTLITFIFGIALATSFVYFNLPLIEIISFISGVLFYIIARDMTSKSMDKGAYFVLGIILAVIPFIINI